MVSVYLVMRCLLFWLLIVMVSLVVCLIGALVMCCLAVSLGVLFDCGFRLRGFVTSVYWCGLSVFGCRYYCVDWFDFVFIVVCCCSIGFRMDAGLVYCCLLDLFGARLGLGWLVLWVCCLVFGYVICLIML